MKKCDMAGKNTFIIKIEYCQNNSWQGKVVWAEGNKEERFRSALELVKLMDEAVTMKAQTGVKSEKTAS